MMNATTHKIRPIHSSIFVTFDRHGIHRYPLAPEEVSYLRNEHRHLFKFRVTIQVYDDDREIEFHMFQNWITGMYDDSEDLKLNHKSCEMIARDLIEQIMGRFGVTRDIEVEVSEDGECGATLKFSAL